MRNRMNLIFGLESLKDVVLMDKKFDLVGITERFEESLVFMSQLLCIPLNQMASVKMKQTTHHVIGSELHFQKFVSLVWRDSGVSLRGRISCLPVQPCWLYSLIALQQHSPLPRRFYPSESNFKRP